MLSELLILLALTLLNGVFASAEIAILSVRKTRLAELVESGSRGARAVLWLRSQPERFLATVQIGITVVSTTAAVFGGDSIAEDLAADLTEHAPWLGEGASRVAFVLVIALISFLGIVLGELVPKSLALRNAERISITLGPLVRAMASVVRPFVWLFTTASNAVLRLFGDSTSFSEARLSPEELQELVEEAGRTGSIDPSTSDLTSRALAFREITAADLMVPRESIVSISHLADASELRRTLAGRRFSHMPVFQRDPDDIVGYVALKDLVVPALDGAPLRGVTVHSANFVPATTPAMTLLRRMQTERISMIFLIDELGVLLGLVTIEDLVEEVMGDISSESDPHPPILALGPDGTVVVPGPMHIRRVNRALELSLPEPDSVTTVAGLCIEALGRVPKPGERATLPDGYVLEVVDATPRRVRAVRIHLPVRSSES